MFEEWLSPDVVRLLISEYAQTSETLGTLKWEYTQTLGARTWGKYIPTQQRLLVSSAKTKDLFKQQVQTILHEIQHWNQHVKLASTDVADPVGSFMRVYNRQHVSYGYWDCPMEVDARAFADKHLEDAMLKVGRHYGGRLEGGSVDGVVEELMDEFLDNDEMPLPRVKIGATLRDYDLNTPENMKTVISKLIGLGVKVS